MTGPVVTVNGLTAAAMQVIKDASVVSGAVDSGTGHLHLTTHGGSDIDAGNVKGATGATGATGPPATSNKVGPFNVVIASGLSTAINTFQIKPISLGGTIALWNCLDANATAMGVSIVSNYLLFSQPGSYDITGYIVVGKGASAGRVMFEAIPETSATGTYSDHDNIIRLDHTLQGANDSITYQVSTVFEVGATPLYLRFQQWDGAGPTAGTSGSLRISRRA